MVLTALLFTTIVAKTTFRGAQVSLCRIGSSYELEAKTLHRTQRFMFSEKLDDMLEPSVYDRDCVLTAADIGVDGHSYLVAELALFHNSGGLMGAAHIFDMRAGQLHEVAVLDSNQMFTFGKLESGFSALSQSYEIGDTLSHGSMPRWLDYYQVRASRLVKVSHSPRLYRPWMKSLWETLSDFPDDSDCWHFYGVAARRSGVNIQPKTAYARKLAERKHWQLDNRQPKRVEGWLRQQIRLNKWPGADRPRLEVDSQPAREIHT